MGPIDCLGVSRAALYARVREEAWDRWTRTEPMLLRLGSLEDLRELRGREADAMLGALVRLAAKDGGDDQLAAMAVAHQLDGGARRLAYGLRDLAPDIDPVVMGTMWMEIRSFPWRRRTRSYAANLLWDTRSSVLKLMLPSRTRSGFDPVVLVDPQSPTSPILSAADPPGGRPRFGSPEQSRVELLELLDWAQATGIVTTDDIALLLDIVDAGEVVGNDSGRTLRGMTSQAAVLRVAAQRGVCGKTVMRHRDRVVAALRAASATYLSEVA